MATTSAGVEKTPLVIKTNEPVDADHLRLAQMGKSSIETQTLDFPFNIWSGHIQELQRHFSTLSLIGLASTTTISWTGLGLGLVTEIEAGGPGAVIYGFILVAILQCFLGASLAESVSSYPTEGGMYHWIAAVAPRKLSGILSFFTGWFSVLGWIFTTASTNLIFSDRLYKLEGWWICYFLPSLEALVSALIMTAYLRLPFASLSCDDLIARGSGGQVLAISQSLVLKCPTLFDNPAPSQEAEMRESAERIENEKRIYSILGKRRHPHLLFSPRCISQGIFLHRQAMTLDNRIRQCPSKPLPYQVQETWIRQLSSALSWLEKLGLVHGDLRPANIFLTADGDEGNVQLGDFDAAVEKGNQLLVASEPFCRVLENYELPTGTHITEQFALGSCIYTIRFQRIPWHDVDPLTRVRRLMCGELPETSSDTLFGILVSTCWLGSFTSVHAVEEEIVRLLQQQRGAQVVDKMLSSTSPDLISTLNAECDEFLVKNG
ncbi:hypothetical protein F66182_9973 [Fusarium sp. NRRL 66182]|nr:hypothetical protein F66182_9973 [Fusarium sp. NRRL 66182]